MITQTVLELRNVEERMGEVQHPHGVPNVVKACLILSPGVSSQSSREWLGLWGYVSSSMPR